MDVETTPHEGCNLSEYFAISQLARQWGIAPRHISDLFYARRLDDSRCPIVCGRRVIPADYVPVVRDTLRQAGRLMEVSA